MPALPPRYPFSRKFEPGGWRQLTALIAKLAATRDALASPAYASSSSSLSEPFPVCRCIDFEHVGHILDLVPDLPAHEDGRFLLGGHGEAIAGTRIQFNNLSLMKFVLGRNNQAPKVCPALEVINDDAFHFRTHSRKDERHEIVGERTLLGGAVHEHVDRTANAGIDVNHENSFLHYPRTPRRLHLSE